VSYGVNNAVSTHSSVVPTLSICDHKCENNAVCIVDLVFFSKLVFFSYTRIYLRVCIPTHINGPLLVVTHLIVTLFRPLGSYLLFYTERIFFRPIFEQCSMSTYVHAIIAIVEEFFFSLVLTRYELLKSCCNIACM